MTRVGPPLKQGLYDPAHEHDSCGIGFVVDAHGRKSHSIVEQGVQVLLNLEHRGACGCEKNTGDGAGILMQMPHRFLAEECDKIGITLPAAGRYGAGIVFLPRDARGRARLRSHLGPRGRRRGHARPGLARPAHRQPLARAHRGGGGAGHAPGLRVAARRPSRTTTPSSAGSTSCAAASRTRCAPPTSRTRRCSTCRASRTARSSTKGC